MQPLQQLSWFIWGMYTVYQCTKLEDAHTTHELHCQWWSDQCDAKHEANAASVQQCCVAVTDRLAAGRCRISCSQQGWCQDCLVATDSVEWKQALLARMPAPEVVQCRICQKMLTLNFWKVVQQHTEGAMGIIV